jgi:hypothetical protein
MYSATSCSKDFLLNRHARKLLRSFLFVFVAAVVGCGDASNDVSVDGRVTFRNEPLALGSVTFFPTTGRTMNVPLGDDGTYSTQLPPGEYVVTVNYSEPLPEGFQEGDPTPKSKFVLPPEYTTRARSKLTATVSKDSEEPINFDLK